MGDLSDLKEMIEAQNDSVESYVWKGPKEIVDGEKVQEEIRLMDATEAQLNRFYKHCKSMLYSEDKNNPGRFPLLQIIKAQREKCNAELFLRFLENSYTPDGYENKNRSKISRFTYLQSIRECLANNKEALPNSMWKTTPIIVITSGVPEEFETLSIDTVLSACLDALGVFDRKHITLNFLAKFGVWFTQQEMKDLTEYTKDGEIRNRIDVIKERLNIKPSIKLHIDSKSPLNYTELRSMLNLRTKKYSDLTTDQLLVLRNKILFKLEDEVMFHISQWEDRIRMLLKVARAKGIILDEN